MHIPFSALVYPLLPTGLGSGKAEATVLFAAVSPARTRMKQPEETISQEQGPERVQIPALARLKLCDPGPGPAPPVPLFGKWGQPQNLTPSRSGRLQVLSNSAWNPTGPRGKLGDGLTPDAVQFLPQGFSGSPAPSLQCTGRAPGLRRGMDTRSHHRALPRRKPGKLALSWASCHCEFRTKLLPCLSLSCRAPPALPKGPLGCHSGGQGRQGLSHFPLCSLVSLGTPETRALPARLQILPETPPHATESHGRF